MSDAGLVVERRGRVAVIVIDRPPANTWTAGNLSALYDQVDMLDADLSIDSLVVTGRGERYFCAGDDLNDFAAANAAAAHEGARLIGRAFERLATFRGVTIAAINGYCLGGGLECALACDIRICEAHARLGLPEARVGLLPCGGGTQRLPWLVGEGWAKRLVLCAEQVDADTALRIGLVEEVVPSGAALAAALRLAESAANQGPHAVVACKRLIDAVREHALNTHLPRERDDFVDLFSTSEPREGVAAFLEKRAPNWTRET